MRTLRLLKVNNLPASPAADCLYLLKEAHGGLNVVLYNRSRTKYAKAVRNIILKGSRILYQSDAGQSLQATYTIDNFDSFTTYDVSVSAGSVTLSGNTLTVTTPSVAGPLYLTVNGEVSIIAVLPPSVKAPSIVYPTNSLSNLATNFTATVSAFASSTGSDTMLAMEWQVSADVRFSGLAASGTVNGAATSIEVSGLAANTQYYMRVRHQGTALGYSAWSPTVKFKTKLAALGLTETAMLRALSPQNGDANGYAVCLSGDGNWAATGAYAGRVNGSSRGWVDLYHRQNGTWVYVTRIFSPDINLSASQYFGASLYLNNDATVLVVGATRGPVDAVSYPGAAYVFVRNGSSWSFVQKLTGSEYGIIANGDSFGKAVTGSASGDYLIVSAYGRAVAGNSRAGIVFVYVKSGTGWVYQAALVTPDLAPDATFGWSVSCDESASTLVIGSDGYNSSQGAVYVFTRSESTWSLKTRLLPVPYVEGMRFGSKVAISADGKWLSVGAVSYAPEQILIGAVFVFQNLSGDWTLKKTLYPSAKEYPQSFGVALAFNQDGSRLFIGYAQLSANNQTYVEIYERSGTSWAFVQRITRSAFVSRDNFGADVSCSGDGARCIVGARSDASVVTNGGAAFIFE